MLDERAWFAGSYNWSGAKSTYTYGTRITTGSSTARTAITFVAETSGAGRMDVGCSRSMVTIWGIKNGAGSYMGVNSGTYKINDYDTIVFTWGGTDGNYPYAYATFYEKE